MELSPCHFFQQRTPRVPFVRLLLAATIFAAFWIGPNMTNARSESAAILHLACDGAPADLCGSVAQVIAERSHGRYEIRHVAAPKASPERASDLSLTVVLDGRGENWIAAHLDWQHGPDGARHSGPSMEMSVMDTTLKPRMYDRFAENLIRADAAIAALLFD